MTAYKLLLMVHVAAGSLALLTYWTAAVVRKGSMLHRRVGQVFLLAMLGIVLTALPIAAKFFVEGKTAFGVFFAYLVVITFTGLWTGWRAIRDKRDLRAFLSPFYRALAWFNIVAGTLVFATGLQISSMLLSVFCWIGIIGGIGMLRQLRAPPEARNWWLKEHYSAMIANGIATHVAFLGLGLSRMLRPLDIVPPQELAWFAPLVVAVIARVYLDRKHAPPATRAIKTTIRELNPTALPDRVVPNV